RRPDLHAGTPCTGTAPYPPLVRSDCPRARCPQPAHRWLVGLGVGRSPLCCRVSRRSGVSVYRGGTRVVSRSKGVEEEPLFDPFRLLRPASPTNCAQTVES